MPRRRGTPVRHEQGQTEGQSEKGKKAAEQGDSKAGQKAESLLKRIQTLKPT